jgi:predicted component of type VI protein secretion system
MSRKSQQILIVTAILMTVALLMVFVGGMGVGEPEADSVDIYLNEIDTLVTENPAGTDTSNLDEVAERAERLEESRTQGSKARPVESEAVAQSKSDRAKERAAAAQREAEHKAAIAKQDAERKAAIAKQDAERKAADLQEDAVAVINDTVIDDTQEEPKAKKKKEKKEGKPSKMKEFVKSYAKRVKPVLEARGMDLSDLEGKSPGDQIKAVGKKLIEAIRSNGGSVFGA